MNTRFDDLVITHWGARFQGQRFACAIGRGGIGVKGGEGDGITPVGRFQIMGCRFRNDRIRFHGPGFCRPEFRESRFDTRRSPLSGFPCQRILLTDVWSDDPADPEYNQLVHLGSHLYSHEGLRRADPLYDILAILDFNYPNAVAGKGSAIFLHKWRKPRYPTQGCVGFAENDLVRILKNWTARSRVIIR